MGNGKSGVPKKKSGFVNTPTGDADKYTIFNSYEGGQKWFNNPKLSNSAEWANLLTHAEMNAVKSYTGSSYSGMNDVLYTTEWEDISPAKKEEISNLYNAINKFELKHGITITRASDFQIFGAEQYHNMSIQEIKDYLAPTNGVLQNDGFLSTGANMTGASIEGSGLVVHYQIPPSKGAVAYVNLISSNKGSYENEVLMNDNSVLHFDVNTLHKGSDGYVHITATWLGQAKEQALKKKKKSK